MRGYLLTAMVLAAGCRVEVDYGATQFRCDRGVCPAGQSCVGGLCVGPGGADATVDGFLVFDGDRVLPDAAAADVAMADATLSDASLDGGPVNLLTNGNLESGAIAPWTPFEAALRMTTTTPHSGTYGLVACKQPSQSASLFTVYQDVISGQLLTPGAKYHASIWVRASFTATELPPPTLKAVLRERGSVGASAGIDHAGAVGTPVTTTWMQLTVDATIAAADHDKLIFIVWPDDVPDGVCFAIDDAVVWRE